MEKFDCQDRSSDILSSGNNEQLPVARFTFSDQPTSGGSSRLLQGRASNPGTVNRVEDEGVGGKVVGARILAFEN